MQQEELPFEWQPIQAKLIRANGTDLDVVNAARRSFGKQSDWAGVRSECLDGSVRVKTPYLSEQDAGLLRFLGRGFKAKDFDEFVLQCAAVGWSVHEEVHTESDDENEQQEILQSKINDLLRLLWKWRDEPVHDTPFNHVGLHVAIMVPMFTARQLVKHEYMPWSEVSRRYKEDKIVFWKPGLSDGIVWRQAPLDKKQGSGGPLSTDAQIAMDMAITSNTFDAYNRLQWLLHSEVCMEQARMLLPANLMVEVTWSGFLGAFCKMLRERLGLGAQEEARVIARMLYDIAVKQFPVSVPALVRNR